jgi:hypothetical protein
MRSVSTGSNLRQAIESVVEISSRIVGHGSLRFDWTEWDTAPTSGELEWAHHGLAATVDGLLIAFDQQSGDIVIIDPSTRDEARRLRLGLASGHGITSTIEAGQEVIWVADNGVRAYLRDGMAISEAKPPIVMKVDSEGAVLSVLPPPPRRLYRSHDYLPTDVAVADHAVGGNGDIWVADGYGASLVHRYDAAGRYKATLRGGGDVYPFDLPHAIFLDTRSAEPEMLVADRRNARIQVFDLDGSFKRLIGAGDLSSPSGFTVLGDRLIVAELRAHLSVLDGAGRLVGRLGVGEEFWTRSGWPNRVEDGRLVREATLPKQAFWSPHGLVECGGRLFVSEWLVGGRLIELRPVRERMS